MAQLQAMQRLYLQSLEACAPDMKVQMRRGQLCFFGEGGVGKTTVLRALRGKEFQAALKSTQVRCVLRNVVSGQSSRKSPRKR